MKIRNSKIVLTGAAGGIGNILARQLQDQGAHLALVDRDQSQLESLATSIDLESHGGVMIAADLGSAAGINIIQNQLMTEWDGVVDIVIHAAGVMDFAPFEEMLPDSIHRMVVINLEAPIQLTRALLPSMLKQNTGCVVFVGSVLGALGLPYFSTYSASKFALRGFAEALRREVYGTGIDICYIGPRSVKTKLNAGAVERMAVATGMTMDDPELVSSRIIQVIEKNQVEVHLGFPESFFVKLNAFLPRLVDFGMRGQKKTMEPFARKH